MNSRRQHLRQHLDLRLSQKLALTPSLLQKIELLQLNKLELQEMLNEELVSKPVLEEVLEPEAPKDLGLDGTDEAAPAAEVTPSGERDSFDEIDFRYFFDEYLDTGYRNREVDDDSENPSFEAFLVRSSSLHDHLIWQIGLIEIDSRTLEIAKEILGNVDQDGYLRASLEEICDLAGCTMEEAERALKAVQALDPPGVGARDLREALSIQLEYRGLRDTLAWKIVQEHLPLLETHKFKAIASLTGSSFEEVLQALDIVKHLVPAPGQKYNPEKVAYVQPEVTIAKVDDEFVILLNDEGMPHLRLNN